MATAGTPRLCLKQELDDIDTMLASEVIARVGGQAFRQPAGLGKIQEIDLGPDSTLRNIARTKVATQNMSYTDDNFRSSIYNSMPTIFEGDGNPRKPKKRRNSENLNRDRLVEEVLRESRCMLYPFILRASKKLIFFFTYSGFEK